MNTEIQAFRLAASIIVSSQNGFTKIHRHTAMKWDLFEQIFNTDGCHGQV